MFAVENGKHIFRLICELLGSKTLVEKDRCSMHLRSNGLRAALAVLVAFSVQAYAQHQPEPPNDERSVYEAVLGLMDNIPVENLHVTIYGTTLNTKCGKAAYPSPLANGCTFLWIKPDTAGTVKKLLHQEWPGFEDGTWSDFEAKNATSIRLSEPITTPWKHKLVFPGDLPDKDWENPNLAIFFSRVGFDQNRREAVVYVLIFSYMDQLPSAGDYFLFRIGKTGHWEPHGRVTYFSKGQDQPSN